ncbi:SDR family oxidoreductase [Paenimyroides aestuarii]|uniref:SDR family oxidoreductase n=1 Tax=Paenimyroides aestuarii TaxID=2968490 RepID=A0ABY5NUX0_9FLAO|nr:SDR family oxidoreductase [Paenimyroides aestuarii]UUV22385.1 SDR family oxidoreductase [Paenimyroides aestuarii]
MKIAITGASGKLGNWAILKLKEKTAAENIVALVRTPEKVANLGVEARAFDYNQPENLATALQGIDKLLLISGNEIGKRFEQHSAVINAAKEAGVKHLVYTSLLKADQSTLALAPEHLQTEEALKSSGIDYTILRNGWYTENYTETAQDTVKQGTLYGASGNGSINSASREDYAEAAAVVLSEDAHTQKTYELSGEESFTMQEYANALSVVSKKEIPYVNLPENEFANALEQAGMPQPVAAFYAGTHTATANGDLSDEGNTLRDLIGRPTTTLQEALTKALH